MTGVPKTEDVEMKDDEDKDEERTQQKLPAQIASTNKESSACNRIHPSYSKINDASD